MLLAAVHRIPSVYDPFQGKTVLHAKNLAKSLTHIVFSGDVSDLAKRLTVTGQEVSSKFFSNILKRLVPDLELEKHTIKINCSSPRLMDPLGFMFIFILQVPIIFFCTKKQFKCLNFTHAFIPQFLSN